MAHVIRRVRAAAAPAREAIPEIVDCGETARVDARHLQDLMKLDEPAVDNPRFAHTVRRAPSEPRYIAKGSAIEIPVHTAATAVMPADEIRTISHRAVTENGTTAPDAPPATSRATLWLAGVAVLAAGTACILALVV